MEKNMFEVATREKVRFAFRGLISTESLWDLSLQDLDSVYKGLNAQVKASEEDSLLGTKTKQNKSLEVQVEIVKHIVTVKLEEQKNRLEASEKRVKKQKIMEIMANKQDEALINATPEQLEQMLKELE